jgi:hypothetical protein
MVKERTRPTLLLYEARWRGIEQSPCHIGEMPDFVAGIFPEEKDFTLSSAGGIFPGSRENKKLAPLVPGRVSSTSRRSRQGEPGTKNSRFSILDFRPAFGRGEFLPIEIGNRQSKNPHASSSRSFRNAEVPWKG